ncbi:MAG: acyclic terpene utilization AtuA family protein [Gammaproteobacteria bacterium]
MSGKIVRIGGASGFWGDSSVAAPQLVRRAQVDYLTFDYLAEVTMAILARARARKPELGYATDFVDVAMAGVIKEVAARGIRVLTNAGGINPRACAQALEQLARREGVALKIAVVEGDDVAALLAGMGGDAPPEMTSGAPLPAKIASANAYLGALPIAAALAGGAQVVITGRCVDSALPLAALIHEFGWRADDYDRLAAGSLAGHILECGAQGSGGLHTDWERVERWHDIGYPIAECGADGEFTITKPAGTGGLVTPAVVAEQMLYELGDPRAYVLPDVICDFTAVTMRADGPDRVRVRGARGHAPTGHYKVSVTHMDGLRSVGTLVIIGIDAAAKAQRSAQAILARCAGIFAARGIAPFRATHVEVLGAESIYGPHARAAHAREVVMRLVVEHDDPRALEIFAREIAPSGTSWSPGTAGSIPSGRPPATPVVRLFSCLLPKEQVRPRVSIEGVDLPVSVPAGQPWAGAAAPELEPVAPHPPGGCVQVPLIRIAWARSGDKGDVANIGVIARAPQFLPVLRAGLSAARVAEYFRHLVHGRVDRYELPGIGGFNFVMQEALGGGGTASMRIDPLAKSMAQMLLDLPIEVPIELLAATHA